MFKRLCVVLSALMLYGSAADVVPHDQDYYTAKVRNTELIYTRKNLPFAKTAAAVQMQLQPQYEELFGYAMDEQMFIGLLSDYNQIANGFAMPYPNNRQMNYIGGAMMVDYFSATSWLKTLLYHETAHNYQINAKDNIVSGTLHTVFRNGSVLVPWFNLPNITESSFLLEGNAVLNESYHGNGGRLYSGRFKAEMLMQAKAHYLTPERIYNDNYFFLYGSHHYTLGGYYHYYMAQRYGLKALNSYWREHSKEWFWPFFTNNAMERAVGVDFEYSVARWSEQMSAEAEHAVVVSAEQIAASQFLTPLNADAKEIFFLINESGRETPELVRLRKDNLHVNKVRRSYIAGKVLHVKGKYVTQATAMTSPLRIYQGLYDENGYILEGSRSKVVQGYLSNGDAVYFDVATSFDEPQLYVGNRFYAVVNSSVFIDEADNLYYFKQQGKERTLYKNRIPLFSFQGYYGFVCDVDGDGALYFIANSQYGSTLYRFNKGVVERMSRGDTILDARLIDATKALVVSVGSDAYTYEIIPLQAQKELPYSIELRIETESPLVANAPSVSSLTVDLNHSYSALLNMNYSGTNLMMSSDEAGTFLYHVGVNFSDPLRQNALSLFSWRDADAVTVAGIGYENSQYLVNYALSLYGVVDDESNLSTRDYGIAAQLRLPFLKRGYDSGDVSVDYVEDYETQTREPLSLTLNLSRQKQFGVSMFPNFLTALSLYTTHDRNDISYGTTVRLGHELWGENYLNVTAQYVKSDAKTPQNEHGIKVSNARFDTLHDPTVVVMPSLRDTLYIERATAVGIRLNSVFNRSAYFFTFPISLRREALELAYSYYRLEGFTQQVDVNEWSIGMTFDTLWMNRLSVPMTLTYLYNDNEHVAKKETVRFSLGIVF